MWELDYKESWALKNWYFWTVVLEKTLEGPLDCKEIKPVHPKGNQSWVFFIRTDVEGEAPTFWPPDAKRWLIWNDPDVGKDWRQEEKGTTKDEMVRWHHWLYGHEFEQALGVGDGQGSLACCSPRGHKGSDTTEWLNCTELSEKSYIILFHRGSQETQKLSLLVIYGTSLYILNTGFLLIICVANNFSDSVLALFKIYYF